MQFGSSALLCAVFCLVSDLVAGSSQVCRPVRLPSSSLLCLLGPTGTRHLCHTQLQSHDECLIFQGSRMPAGSVSIAFPQCFNHPSPPCADAGCELTVGVWVPRWSFGSVLFLASWAVLMGPLTYAKHLISGPRLPFTAVYFASIVLTLFSAMKVRLHLSSCHCVGAALRNTIPSSSVSR